MVVQKDIHVFIVTTMKIRSIKEETKHMKGSVYTYASTPDYYEYHNLVVSLRETI